MKRGKDGSQWEIACANHSDSSNSNEPTWCTTTSTILNASSVFGRHTRCYAARCKVGERIEEGIVKDSWSLPRDKQKSGADAAYVPDEAYNLRLIAATLGKEKQSFLYPKAVFSGSVMFRNGKECVKDDTSKIFEHDETEEEKLTREHSRIFVTPVGDYLDTVENEEELVLVLADAMECHNAILTKCRLLHRDISVNNILVVRKFEGKSVRRPVKGLLIDFDHAISIDQQSSGYATRSGTLPFMSIHNLEAHASQRTALDDWESLLYVICWLGTYGVNHRDRETVKHNKVAPIEKWRSGSMPIIANEKRTQMHNLDTFRSNILAGFQDQMANARDHHIHWFKIKTLVQTSPVPTD
ncbi:hypothetical protein EV175_000413 [Coemansia sp. RSA 1933]|nr:hypothetical protein EV175_000413 [Coemansia sp. RSA 1933]